MELPVRSLVLVVIYLCVLTPTCTQSAVKEHNPNTTYITNTPQPHLVTVSGDLSKSGDVLTVSGDVLTKSGAIFPKSGDVLTKSGAVFPKSGDVLTKSSAVLTKSGNVLTVSGDVVTGTPPPSPITLRSPGDIEYEVTTVSTRRVGVKHSTTRARINPLTTRSTHPARSNKRHKANMRQDKHRLLASQREQAYPRVSGHEHPRSDVQIGCKELRSKRYISDGFCTSIKPVTEVVCTGHCLPMTNLPWYAEFIKVWARTKVLEWRCVNDVVKRKRVRLLCENGETRTYRIKVVKSCKCKRYMKQQNQSLASKGRTNGSHHHRRREKVPKKSRTNRVPS